MPLKTLPGPRRQQGLVLILALIVLVAMSLAAIGLMRGVLGSNRVAANLANQQMATQVADIGVERAVAWLEQRSVATQAGASASSPAVPINGLYQSIAKGSNEPYAYSSTRADPGPTQSWEAFWQTLVGAGLVNSLTEVNGNQIGFVIHRLCTNPGPPDKAKCEASPDVIGGKGTSQSNPPMNLGTSPVYYRITVRVQGVRNSTSFIQAIVTM